jgi:hypothetical protein
MERSEIRGLGSRNGGGRFRIAARSLAASAVAINSGVSVSAATLPRYLGEVHPSRSSVTTGSWGGSC